MPWNNQGGGPWQPKNQGPRNPGPWGQGPQGGGGGGGGGRGTPPDLEDLLRRSSDRLKSIFPGGSGGIGPRGLGLIAVLGVLGWLATGIYTVRPDEVGINLVFGTYVGKSQPGLSYNFPYPIGSVMKPRVTAVNKTEIGYRTTGAVRTGNRNFDIEESLMLTGDGNIVDIDFDVQWQIDPALAENYIFNMQNPDGSVKSVAESSMREVIGRRNIQQILTTDRVAIEAEVQKLMQDILNGYGAGVTVRLVQLLKVDPPSQVIDAFRDVQAAQQDQSRMRNEAETYASRIVPEARGQAAKLIQQAEAYREQTVAEANGQAARFTQVFDEYRKAPDVTRQRMFLETMERVFGGTDKIILDNQNNGQSGSIVPYLPLNELQRRPTTAAPVQGTTR